MVAGIRTQAETFVPALQASCPLDGNGTMTVAPRVLARLALSHLHTISASFVWSAPLMSCHPSHLYWKIGDSGLLIRAYHLHPFLACPRLSGREFKGTIDDGLAQTSSKADENVVVVDSDCILIAEMSTHWIVHAATIPVPGRVAAVANWAAAHASSLHRTYAAHAIRVHTELVDDSWIPAKFEPNEVIQRIDRLLLEGMGKTLVLGELDALRWAYVAAGIRVGAADRVAARAVSVFFWFADRASALDKILKLAGLVRRTARKILGGRAGSATSSRASYQTV